jgi:hypothetical protein
MSGNLFTKTDKELQRMESLLRTLRNYNLALSEHKTAEVNGKESKTFYSGTVTGNTNDNKYVYIQMDGDSFPDLFEKISDKLQSPLS